MKISFVFPTNRTSLIKRVKCGFAPDNHLYGFNHFKKQFNAQEIIVPKKIERLLNYLLLPIASIWNTKNVHLNLGRITAALPQLNQSDVVVTYVDSISSAAVLFKKLKLLRPPLVVTVESVTNNRWLWSGADAIITNSPLEYRKITKLNLSQKIFMFPVGSDQAYYQAKGKIENDLVVSVGGDRDRDYQTFIAASRSLPDLKFQIYAEHGNLEGLQIPANVKVFTNANQAQTKQALEKAAIVVIPVKKTNRASGQLSLNDALLMKKSVIVSNNLGMVEAYGLKNKQSVLVVPPENPHSLVTAIKYLYKNPQKRQAIGKAGRRIALQYTTKLYAKKLAQVISDLV